MQVVPLGPKGVKLSEINDYKGNCQHVQPKINNHREETLREEKKEKNHTN